MKDWFDQFSQREQLSLLVLGIAVFLYLLFILIWSPLAAKREGLVQQNQAVASSLTRVDAMVSEFMQLRDSGDTRGARRNLTSVINQSTTNMKLPVSRLQPNSRGEIQVRLENASFDDLLSWLYAMEFKEGLLVREVSITQTSTQGRVNATVRVGQGG